MKSKYINFYDYHLLSYLKIQFEFLRIIQAIVISKDSLSYILQSFMILKK